MASSSQQMIPPPTQINDTHKVYSIAAACIVLGVLTSLFVLIRLGQRIYSRAFGYDDCAIIPGFLFYVGWIAMGATVNLTAGVGKPLWEITVGEYSVWFKGLIGATWLYPAMTASIRVSILLSYYRIFAITTPYMKYAIWILIPVQVVYLIVFSITPAFICRPLYKAWHPLERQNYFHDWYYYYSQVALYSVSVVLDGVLLFLPLYAVLKLQMPLKKRASIAGIFMLGASASITAAYKLAIFVMQMKRYTDINPIWLRYQMSTLIPPQFDKYGTTFWIPSTVEPTVALIGTSFPALRHLVLAIVKHFSKSSSAKSTKISIGSGKSWSQITGAKSGHSVQCVSASEVALNDGDYYELNDASKGFSK